MVNKKHYNLFLKSVTPAATASAVMELGFMSKILYYSLNKNYTGQVTFLQHTLTCSHVWTCGRTQKIYDFIKTGEFFRSLKYLFWSLRANKKAQLLFAADSWENPGEVMFPLVNICDLGGHTYFNNTRRIPGSITNNWWFDFLPNKSIENVISGNSIVILPNLECSINSWRESQIKIVPLLSVSAANRNIVYQSTYGLLGEWNGLVKNLFFCRLISFL